MDEQKTKPIPKGFDIEEHFEMYLKLVGLDKRRAAPNQIKEMKRAYFGAWGQLMMLQKDTLTKFEDDQASDILQDMLN